MRKILTIVIYLCTGLAVYSQTADMKASISNWFRSYKSEYKDLSGARVQKVDVNNRVKTISVYTNFVFGTIPFRSEMADSMKRAVSGITAAAYHNYKIVIYADDKNVETLVPRAYRAVRDKSRMSPTNRHPQEFITPLSRPYAVT